MSNSFEKAWTIAKELSLYERAAAEQFAHPDDMRGYRLKDKVPRWMNRSKRGELNPMDLEELRLTAATSPFRFFDDDEIYERILENMSEDAYNRFELQSDSEKDMMRRIMEEYRKPYSDEVIGECESCGAPAEGYGEYNGYQMAVCRNCA